MYSDIDSINKDIYMLWRDECIKRRERLPLPAFLREPTLNTIAFMGINPSLNKDGYGNLLEKSSVLWIKNLNFEDFIYKDYEEELSEKALKELISKLHEIEDTISDGGHRYIKSLDPIIRELGIGRRNCLFLDLFLFRWNNQNDFLQKFIYEVNDKQRNFTPLAEKLIDITIQAIEINSPRVIVLPNKGAADLLTRKIPSMIVFDEKYGTHTLRSGGQLIPIFLSSNLYMRNRLDKFSQERLVWHVKFVYDQLDKEFQG